MGSWLSTHAADAASGPTTREKDEHGNYIIDRSEAEALLSARLFRLAEELDGHMQLIEHMVHQGHIDSVAEGMLSGSALLIQDHVYELETDIDYTVLRG